MRQHRLDLIDSLYDIGARQLGNGQQYGWPAIRPCGKLRVFCPVDRTTYVAYANRRACAIGDDRVIPGAGRQKLVVVVDRIGSRRPLDTSLRRIGGGRYDHRANVLERQPPAGDLARIDLDSHRRLLLAEYPDLRNAWDLADALREHVLGIVVYLGKWQHVGGQRQDQDGRIGRVHLAIGRRRGKAGRKLARGSVDGGLDVLCRAVDISIEVELQSDGACSERADRGHLRDARDLPELSLQRLRDRRGHGLWAGAGQLRRNLDCRELDLRQRRHRQQRKCRSADDHYSQCQQ